MLSPVFQVRIVGVIDQADVDPRTLHDDRIAVVIPGRWEEIARDISRRYIALIKMKEEYLGQTRAGCGGNQAIR